MAEIANPLQALRRPQQTDDEERQEAQDPTDRERRIQLGSKRSQDRDRHRDRQGVPRRLKQWGAQAPNEERQKEPQGPRRLEQVVAEFRTVDQDAQYRVDELEDQGGGEEAGERTGQLLGGVRARAGAGPGDQ